LKVKPRGRGAHGVAIPPHLAKKLAAGRGVGGWLRSMGRWPDRRYRRTVLRFVPAFIAAWSTTPLD